MSQFPWWSIGRRNLVRNPQRTGLTAVGLGVGFFASVILVGITENLTVDMVENATSLTSGQIEIHDAEFRPDRGLYDTIGGRGGSDVGALLRSIDDDPAVVAAAPRVYAGGLVSTGEATSAGMFMGVDPTRERTLTRFLDLVVEGRVPVSGQNELFIGEAMARQLAVGVDDEIVVVTSGADGSMANDLYTLVGIYRSGLPELDSTFVVMPIDVLQTLLVLPPDRVHEIAVSTADPWIAEEVAAQLSEALTPSIARSFEVVSWQELNPAMVDYVALIDSFYFIIIAIVFVFTIFGVLNSMLMATYERRREFAVLLALGTTPRAVKLIVLSEALALAVVSLVGAAGVTFPVMVWLHNAPPDMSWAVTEVEIMGAMIAPSLQVEYNGLFAFGAAGSLVLTAVVGALWPAVRAASTPSADTLAGL